MINYMKLVSYVAYPSPNTCIDSTINFECMESISMVNVHECITYNID